MTGRVRPAARLAVVGLLVGACGAPAVTPTAPSTPVPTPDPRLEEIEEGRGVWKRRGPGTVAYDVIEDRAGHARSVYHVSEMDGRAEVLLVRPGSPAQPAGPDQTIDRIFDRAIDAVNGPAPDVEIEYDTTYGHITRLSVHDPGVQDASSTVALERLTTPADRDSASRARDALDALLRAWRDPASPTWTYTWTRFGATDDSASASSHVVHHEDGATTLALEAGQPGEVPPPGSSTVQGTVEEAVRVLAAGGWVDVAMDPEGLDTLIAIDPSPSATGDGYWIRLDFTDLYVARATEALATARGRWVAADIDAYRYTLAWSGADGATWRWRVTMDAGVGVVKRGSGAPAPEDAVVRPGIDSLFDLLEGMLAGGGRVTVRYDRERGYPVEIRVDAAGPGGPKGLITVSRFKAG